MNTYEDQIIVRNVVETTTLVSQGAPGPKGDTGIPESSVPYSKNVDFASDTVVYRAEAAVGSLNSAPVWRIRRTVIVGETVTETWASGTALFNKIWDNRISYIYS
jgi:hypothetical protein